VGRIGSFMLSAKTLPEESEYADLAGQIGDQLQQDPRVIDVEVPDIENDWCFPNVLYPAPSDDEGIVTGADQLGRLRFSEPLMFLVEVPVKNQRLIAEGDWMPTRYHVLWDGVTILVSWKAPADNRVPLSGGHIVSAILAEALEGLDLALYVQGCSPECRHEFTHTAIRFVKDGSAKGKPEYAVGRRIQEVEVRYPPDVAAPQFTVFRDLSSLAEEFAHLKNLGRRILEIEADGRGALAHLMAMDLGRAEIAVVPLRSRVGQLWKARGWRRESRRLIARVWASLGNIERLRRQWDQSRFTFDSEAAERGRERLFLLDYANEVDGVSSFKPDLMRAAVGEAGTRLDNHALLLVTGLGAVAGAIAGGVVGGLAGNGF
jgi:hypothetical protein